MMDEFGRRAVTNATRGPRLAPRALLAALLVGASAPQPPPHPCPEPFSEGDLPRALAFCDGAPVQTAGDWAARRAQIGELLQAHLYGFLPPAPPPALTRVALTNASEERGFRREWYRATFANGGGAAPPAGLAVEFEAIYAPGACSAAARCPVFLVSREHRRWAVAAALRGYVAISLCVGDSCPWATTAWAATFPNATFALIAQRAYLSSRALDAVLTLPFVDASAVGATGHSRNGKLALIAAAFDERIGAVVDSSSGAAGIAAYRLSGGEAQCERPASSWPGAWWLPSLRDFDGREDALPVDAHSVAALIAPRPLLLATATNDGVEPSFAVERAFEEAAEVYAFLGAPKEALAIDYRPGDHHGFERVDRYLDYLDAAFNHSITGQSPPPHFPFPSGSGGGGDDSGEDQRLHAFNWSAWALRQGAAPPAPPPPSAPAAERLAWLLGDAPASAVGPPWDSGGSYPPAEDLAYADLLQLRDAGAAALPAVQRLDVAFGANVIGASLFFRSDMARRTPPSAAGWPAIVYLSGANYNKGPMASYVPAGASGAGAAAGPARALANSSFVVLTYDQLGTGLRLGEGSQLYARFPRWSRMGAAVFDAMSAVDLLLGGADQAGADDALAFPPVDAGRIYLVGYGGLGGPAALFAAAADARVAGVATVCGWSPLRNDTDASRSGGTRRFFERHATLPRLGFFRGAAQADLPADFDDALALVAPRPALVFQPLQDRMNDAAQVAAVVARLELPRLSLQTPPGANAMGDAAVAAVAAWAQAAATS